MEEEFWLKYGLKENGELTCLRMLSRSEPEKDFFYTENGEHKQVRSPNAIRITKEILNTLVIGGTKK